MLAAHAFTGELLIIIVYLLLVTEYMETRVRSKLQGLLDESDFDVGSSEQSTSWSATVFCNSSAVVTESAQMSSQNESEHSSPPSSQQDQWQRVLAKLDGAGPPLKSVRKTEKKVASACANSVEKNPSSSERFSEAWLDTYFDPMVHGYWRAKGGDLVYRMPNGQQVRATGVDAFGPFAEMPLHVQRERNASFWEKMKAKK